MANIYDITGAFYKLWELMDEGEIDEQVLIDAMADQTEELAYKMEGYSKVIKNMEADVNGLKGEIERLTTRKKSLENNISRMKSVMLMAMNAAGEKKVKGELFTVGVQNNPPSVVMDEQYIENVPSKYLIPQEPKIDRKKIAEDLKAGENLEGLAHLEVTTGIRIR